MPNVFAVQVLPLCRLTFHWSQVEAHSVPVCLFVAPSAVALIEGGSDAARFIPVLVPHPGVGQLNVLLVFDLHPVTKTGTQIYACVHKYM